MSEENVELVRSGAEALAQGDLDVAQHFLDPAFEFDVTRTDLNPRVYRGLEGLLELMSEWTSTWDETTSARMRPPSSTTAAAVSSHELSRPRTFTRRL